MPADLVPPTGPVRSNASGPISTEAILQEMLYLDEVWAKDYKKQSRKWPSTGCPNGQNFKSWLCVSGPCAVVTSVTCLLDGNTLLHTASVTAIITSAVDTERTHGGMGYDHRQGRCDEIRRLLVDKDDGRPSTEKIT